MGVWNTNTKDEPVSSSVFGSVSGSISSFGFDPGSVSGSVSSSSSSSGSGSVSGFLKKLQNEQSGTVRRYPAGTILDLSEWKESFAWVQDGFLISTKSETGESAPLSAMELLGSGNLLCVPPWWLGGAQEDVFAWVILETHIVFIPAAQVDPFWQKDIEFVQAVCQAYRNKYEETALAFQEIGTRDARRAIAYVLRFCKEHAIPSLTHAQIALTTGLARPTVTRILGEMA